MPQSEFLTLEELADLTGYTQKKRQMEWLKERYAIQGENRYKPLVLYKDVFGQPRQMASNEPITPKWQPPTYLTGATNGKTKKTNKPAPT